MSVQESTNDISKLRWKRNEEIFSRVNAELRQLHEDAIANSGDSGLVDTGKIMAMDRELYPFLSVGVVHEGPLSAIIDSSVEG